MSQETTRLWQKKYGTEYLRKWRKHNPEKRRIYDQKRNGNKEYLEKRKKRREKQRLELIKIYGGACVCCGEKHIEFLVIDHVNNDGNEHRKAIGNGGQALYAWLKRNNYPQDRFQLLCFNCNWAKSHYGQCPHKSKGSADKSKYIEKIENGGDKP